jgi:hypothetical protein
MRMTDLAGVLLGLALVTPAAPAIAHHAFAAEFDANKPVNLRGVVTKMDWLNPHAWIHMEVKLPNGKVESWMIEAGAPNALLRRGFNRTSLPPGTEIVVEGFRAKNGLNRANGFNITLPDGKVLFIGSSGTGAPYEKSLPEAK